jgi:hypothetical protein
MHYLAETGVEAEFKQAFATHAPEITPVTLSPGETWSVSGSQRVAPVPMGVR